MASSETDYEYLHGVAQEESTNQAGAGGDRQGRGAQIEERLKPIAWLAGVATVDNLVGLLRADRKPQLHRAVAEAMTVNETSFFRDRGPFEALRETILPRLIEQNAETRRLHIWSAACSTGQEAYSVAMLLREHFPALAGWDVKIVGTDLSQQVVEYAQRGRYRRIEVNRGLPARMLLKYLNRDRLAQGQEEWEVAARVRALCEFQCVNLGGPLPTLPVFDLVLLRNVLLYFSPHDRGRVLASVGRQMTPDGYLLLGAAEQAEDSTNLFKAEFAGECYFYRQVAGA
jgi:chemotaxis protein methyltransferase CheR